MDRFYDKELAAERLEELASQRRQVLSVRVNSSAIHMADMEASLHLHKCEFNEDNVSDEMVAHVQGVLTKNNLVPKNTRLCPSHKAAFLSQSAEISGLNTMTFAEAMGNLSIIGQKFGEHLPGVDVTNGDGFSGLSTTFSASNRIFTSRGEAPHEQDNAFHEGLDPLGHMAKLKNGELIHAPENMVKYYKRIQRKGTNCFGYEEHLPGGFKIGDIVEMQVSFVAIASGHSKVKVTSRLQAMTLLDHTFAKDAATERRAVLTAYVPSPAVRRKVGYFPEDDDDERKFKKSKSQTGGNGDQGAEDGSGDS
ncbi:hypothetical protein B0H16DRAFT_1731670 [Mycena metata]|uniref:Uncharacterized protein n=1 Tax=Mycena metata TaxID=1033252 RepID=A0AAD7I5J2_9AGAR|nr:hypothetical protein B0H16DRAFT_1731670 [Mycena metata]